MAVTTRTGAFMGGEWVVGEGGEIDVRSPANGELLGTVTAASPAQVDGAVQAAADAFDFRRHATGMKQITIDLA